MSDSKLLTAQEVARFLGVTPDHVRLMLRAGLVRAPVKHGRDWLLTESQVNELRRRQTRKKAS